MNPAPSKYSVFYKTKGCKGIMNEREGKGVNPAPSNDLVFTK